MGGPLNYDELYRLSEELQQLVGSPLNSVVCQSETRFALGFRHRWLIVDLTPNQPFILSTSLTKTKGPKKVTPVGNFMKAHFVGLILKKWEVAQKPNRTVLITFGDETKSSSLEFKCFPHGQHLILKSEKKIVNLPLRPRPKDEEAVTFVEPELVSSWSFNDELGGRFIEGPSHGHGSKKEALEKESNPYHSKLMTKLEKSIAALNEGIRRSHDEDDKKIHNLEIQAQELKTTGQGTGPRIQSIYDEIKRIKRKALTAATRRNELTAQLTRLRENPDLPVPKRLQQEKKSKKEDGFSGTKVVLDPVFQLWVGRNAWQNDDLIRLASPHDLWIHLRDYPGAHGVIRAPKKSEPSSSQVDFSCRVVASLSASKKKPFKEGEMLDFIVTPRKFVKKPKGAAPGRVIVERETVRRVAYKSVKFEVD